MSIPNFIKFIKDRWHEASYPQLLDKAIHLPEKSNQGKLDERQDVHGCSAGGGGKSPE